MVKLLSAHILLLIRSTAGTYKPFADVHELAPHRFHDYCGARDANTRLAKCHRSVQKRLDDDGEINFSWAAEMDPDSVLSLDTEGASGVKLINCDERSLDLELPPAYAQYAKEGTVVVASRFVHNCRHLGGEKHMMRRIVKIERLTKTDRSAPTTRVRAVTKALKSVAEVFPSVSFNFSYMPAEAREKHNPFPALRTKPRGAESRRLDVLETAIYDGNPQQSANSDFGVDSQNSLINFQPNQLSNFGWNWNFFLNSTQEPQFSMALPGLNGYVKLKQPYIKVHAGIYLNFTSKFGQLLALDAPEVSWQAGIDGHGSINARMMTEMRTLRDASEDPFSLFNIPVLEQLKKTRWLETIDFAMGAAPMTVTPGFQFKAEMYHIGQFDGTLQLGGKTNFVCTPQVSFNSATGLQTKFKADFDDTTLYPPLWIVATQHFEMGLMLEPTMWIKSDLGGNQQSDAASIGFEGRPFLNVTINREGKTQLGDEMRSFIAYPFRVIGLPTTGFAKKYSVKIEANGATMTSTPELNWGQVEVHDHMSVFNAGSMPQKAVLENAVRATLLEIDPVSGAQTALGTGEVTCGTLLNGECQPNPAIAQINVNGKTVRVEMVMLWMDNPVPWFASRIRGVAMSFPSITLNTAVIGQAVPELQSGTAPASKMYLRATHAGKTYVSEVTDLASYSMTGGGTLSGATVVEFGPTFLESWIPCGADDCITAKLELYYGSTLLGSNQLPQIPFASSIPDLVSSGDASAAGGSSNLMDAMLSQSPTTSGMGMLSSMLTSTASHSIAPQNIPLSISLFAAPALTAGSSSAGTSTNSNVAVVHAAATVMPPSVSSIFLQPQSSQQVGPGGQQTVIWTIAYVQPQQSYNFRTSAWKVASGISAAAAASYPSVGGAVLQPVSNTQEQLSLTCSQAPVNGMDSSSAPCSFSHLVKFDAATFLAGDVVVLLIEWIDGNKDHVMYSPPFSIGTGALSRRLESAAPARRMWTQSDWDARLAANAGSCKQRDLHFEVGFGMMVRAKMLDANMPMMPMMMPGFNSAGGSNGMPVLSTGFQKIGQQDMVDSDLDKLLPSWLCADGVCSGKMPGCTKADFKTMYFPTLVFHFNRDFLYSDLSSSAPVQPKMLKTALAYAFSTLPEVVTLLLEELNGTSAPATTVAPMTTSVTPAQLNWPVSGSNSATGYTTTVLPMWGGRRLRASEEASPVTRKAATLSSKVTMKFEGGVPYIVDRPLVEMMMKHGMFQRVDDDLSKVHGPAFIKAFEVYSDTEGKANAKDDSSGVAVLERSWSWMYSRRASGGASRAGLGMAAVAGIVAIAAVASMWVMRPKVSDYGSIDDRFDTGLYSDDDTSLLNTEGPIE